jgi:hypothetical protein
VDLPRLIQEVDEFDWTPIYTTPSVDEQVDFFNGAVRGESMVQCFCREGYCRS